MPDQRTIILHHHFIKLTSTEFGSKSASHMLVHTTSQREPKGEGSACASVLRRRGSGGRLRQKRRDVLVKVDVAGVGANDAALLELETRLPGDEQVGTLDDVLEVRLSILVKELVDVGDVDRLGSAAARHEEVGLEPEVGSVAESNAVRNNLARGQLDVVLLDQHTVSVRAELAGVEIRDHLASLCEAHQLLPIETDGVVDDTATVDDGDRLVDGEQNLVGAEVAVGTARLDLGDLLLPETEHAVDADNVLAHRERSHAPDVVRHTTQSGGGLAGGERLPPGRAPSASVLGGKVHEVGGSLIGAEEEDLLLAEQVDDLLLDSGRLALDEQVEDGIDVLFKGELGVGIKRGQDGALCATFGDLLVLEMLGGGEGIVLVEERALVDRVVFAVPGSDDSDAASGDVAEAHVETAELGADDKDDAVGLDRVLDLGKEAGVKAEGEGDLGGGVEVGLENGLVEEEEGLEDLTLVRVGGSLADAVVHLVVVEHLLLDEPLVGKRRHELLVVGAAGVVDVGKVDVEQTDEGRVVLDDLLDRLTREGLFTETELDLVEDGGLLRVVLVEHVAKRLVRLAEAVAEVLGKEPADVGVGGLLHGVGVLCESGLEEGVVREDVDEGGLLHDLVDRVLDGRAVGSGERVEVDRDDGDVVGELLDVLARREEAVEVVEVREGAEEAVGGAHSVADDDPALAAALDLEHFDDGALAAEDLVHDALVDVERVVASLGEEGLVRDGADVCVAGRVRGGAGLDKVALCEEVASELLLRLGRDRAGGAVGLEAVGLFDGRLVEVVGVDAALPLGALCLRLAGLGRVDEDGAVLGLLFEVNLEAVGVLGVGHDLGAKEREDVVCDRLDALEGKVGVVNTKVPAVIRSRGEGVSRQEQPIDLSVDEIGTDEALAGEELLDLGGLVGLALKDGVRVSGRVCDDVVDGRVGAAPGRRVGRAEQRRLDLGDIVERRRRVGCRSSRSLVYRWSHGG
ncbi:hypothetical protein L1887_57291 [Cichorium endivia]|nr:hypothetical protein L1887_57291 [Cichorium endivia]